MTRAKVRAKTSIVQYLLKFGVMTVSVEIFAPRSNQKLTDLVTFLRLAQARGLTECSITQSASDANCKANTALVEYLSRKLPLDFTMHMSAAATDKEAAKARFSSWKKSGVKNVICLRGDPVADQRPTSATHYASSIELIEAVKQAGLNPWTSGYPSPHSDSLSRQTGLDWTYRKLEVGAKTLVTQFCFDAELMIDWADTVTRYFPDVQIRWGILPIRSQQQIQKLHALNNIPVPAALKTWLDSKCREDGTLPEVERDKQVFQLCTKLKQAGYDKFHFYSFNQQEPTLWSLEQHFGQKQHLQAA